MTWKALELLALLTLLTCNEYADNKLIRRNKPRGPDKKPRAQDNKLIGMDNEPRELDNKLIRLDKKPSGGLDRKRPDTKPEIQPVPKSRKLKKKSGPIWSKFPKPSIGYGLGLAALLGVSGGVAAAVCNFGLPIVLTICLIFALGICLVKARYVIKMIRSLCKENPTSDFEPTSRKHITTGGNASK